MSENRRYFFTYGPEGHPYHGGWTEIDAPDMRTACTIFRAFHPDKTEDCLNCCEVYTEEQFSKTKMAGPDGNLGMFCHEKITAQRETAERKEQHDCQA